MSETALQIALPIALVLLAMYLLGQGRRRAEDDLRIKLRRTEIALHDAEQSLANSVAFYKAELRRLKERYGKPILSDTADTADLPTGSGEAKFRAARSAFARLCHPDRAGGDALEARIRTEIFQTYWRELERIDRGGG